MPHHPRVSHGQYQKIVSPIQPGLRDPHDCIVVTFEQNRVAAAVSLTTGDDAVFKLWCLKLAGDRLPMQHKFSASPSRQ